MRESPPSGGGEVAGEPVRWSELPPPGAAGRRGSVRIREMAELVDTALFALHRDGRVILANAVGAELMQLLPGAATGVNILDYFGPDSRHALATIIGRARADQRLTLSNLEVAVGSSQRKLDAAVTASRVDPDEVLVSLRDVTRESQMTEEVRRARSFFMDLIHSSIECVVAADMKGTIILFNEGAERLLGYREKDVVGKMHITRLYQPGKAQEVMRLLRSSREGGNHSSFRDLELMAVASNGETIPVAVRAAIVYHDGKAVATVGYFHDMRDRLKMERQLRDTQLQLLQAEKMASLGKLAAGIAHQINNPLGGIMLFSELLMEKSTYDPEALEDLQRIVENAARCREIVKDLLDFARQTHRQITAVDINRALRRTIFLLGNQPLFHNIKIVSRMDPDLPFVRADEQQLSQVFMNLILNAAEAMDGHGTLTIRTRALAAADPQVADPTGPTGGPPPRSGDSAAIAPGGAASVAPAEAVEFEIEDTGCGIPADALNRLFEPFFTTKAPGKGTGLGLSVAYGIVTQHGGTIDVRSREGLGTTFTVRLPVGSGATEEGAT